MSRRIIVKPPEMDAYLKYKPEWGGLYMYVGRVTVNGNTMTAVPCRGITDRQLGVLLKADRWLLQRPDAWVEGPDGLTTHVCERVDLDEATAQILDEAADAEIDGWASR